MDMSKPCHKISRSQGTAKGLRAKSSLTSQKCNREGGGPTVVVHDSGTATGEIRFSCLQEPPLVDGNKRVAFVLMDVFLQGNGWEIIAGEEDVYSVMIALASGNIMKSELSSWLKKHAAKSRR